MFTQVGPWGTHANSYKIYGPFQAHTNAKAWIATEYRLIKMHADEITYPNSFDKQSKKLKEIEKKGEKKGGHSQQHCPILLYNLKPRCKGFDST